MFLTRIAFVCALLACAAAQDCPSCSGDDCGCSDSLDVLFVVDTTGSIGQSNFLQYKDYLKAVFGELDLGDNIKTAMVSFANFPERLFSFGDPASTDSDAICDAIDVLPGPKGQTYTHLAIDMATEILSSETRGGDVCPVMIIATDGGSDSKKLLKEAMENFYTTLSGQKAPRVCLVSIGDRDAGGRMRDIERIQGRNLTIEVDANSDEIIASDFDQLMSLVDQTMDCICNCRPQQDDCHCQILADPVVNTCSGETLFMEQTGASYRAVESNDPGCTFTLDVEPVDNSLKLTLEMGANMWTISPDGTVDPALPAIPGVTAVNFVDGSYTGTNYQFDCGIEIRFGTEGDNFVKADIKVPGGKRDNIVDGFCVTDSLGKKTTTTTTTPPPI